MARRMDDYIRMIRNECPAGASFGNKPTTSSAAPIPGAANCSAQTLVAVAGPGGMFGDFLRTRAMVNLSWTCR